MTPTRRDLSLLLAALTAAAASPALAQRRAGGKVLGPEIDWPYTDFGAPGVIAQQGARDDMNLSFVRFANGVQLTIMPTPLAREHALVRVRIGYGELDLPKDRVTAVGALGPRIIQGGLDKMTADEVTAALRGKKVSASLALQPGGFVELGVTAPKDLALQLQVLAAYVAYPGWRTDDFQDDVETESALYTRAAAKPDRLLNQQLGNLLCTGDQRWRKADPAMLAKMKPQDIRTFMEPILAKAPIEVVIVGDVSPEPVIKAVAATFGALPKREVRDESASARERHFPAPTLKPTLLYHDGPQDQAIVLSAWPTIGYHDRQGSFARKMMQMIAAGRLDDMMLANAFSASSLDSDTYEPDTYPNYGYVSLQATTTLDQIAKIQDAMTVATTSMGAEIKDEELERVRTRLAKSWDQLFHQNSYWMVALANGQNRPEHLDELRNTASNLKAVTTADVKTAAQTCFPRAKAWRLVVLPKGATLPASAA